MIRTHETPNPNAYRFVVEGVELSPVPLAFDGLPAPAPADALLALPGVMWVYVAGSSLTITQDGGREWLELAAEVRHVLLTGPAFPTEPDERFIVAEPSGPNPVVNNWFIEHILPATGRDGGGLLVRDLTADTITLEAVGACRGCPHLQTTVEQGIIARLRGLLPELCEAVVLFEGR